MNKFLVDKLKEGRLKKNLKQSDVTKYTGIKNTTLSNYENGITEPDIDTFLQLCELYELDYVYILGEAYGLGVQGSSFTIKPSEIKFVKKYRNLDDFGKESVEIVLDRETRRVEEIQRQKEHIKTLETEFSSELIPTRVISYCQRLASAGSGEYLFDDVPTDVIKVEDAPEARKADFAIGVNGNSMEPDYYDGEKVFVEKTPDIKVGEVGVFVRGNECFIKECGENGLISRNKDYPGVEPFSDGIKVVGRVIGKVTEVE